MRVAPGADEGTLRMAYATGQALLVPELPHNCDIVHAAILYAEAGWYVIAVESDSKKPAQFYGRGWQHMSSRDPHEIASWFAGTDYALGLHVGRSGAVVFDMDVPEDTPAILQRAFDEFHPLIQSTRKTGERGHRVFVVPEGRRLGNSRGELGRESKTWGEVRGNNGIIVVEPSRHEKIAEGGRYKWLTTGLVPTLPDYIADLLPEAGVDTEPATDATLAAFIAENNEKNTRPQMMKGLLNKYTEALSKGSRHEATVEHLCWAMREVRYGWYPASTIIDTMESIFVAAMAGERHPKSEFKGALAFAVAQALLIDPEARRQEAVERLRATDALKQAGVGITPARDRPKVRPRSPDDYFTDRERGIDIELLANDIISLGPLALGGDGAFWMYDHGVWRWDKNVVPDRTFALLGPRYRGSHSSNARDAVQALVGTIACDPVPEYMNFANGMLDWRSGEMTSHGPHYGSTVQFPIEWDATATCPHFDSFLETILTEDYIALVWQMLGYLLYSGNPNQKAFLMLGTGSNGKGTLMRVIAALLGAENCSAESLDELNTNRFAAFSLFGKIANLAGDIDATYQTSTASFKKLTGEDLYYGERKYGDRFGFKSWAVPVFSANKIPGSADTSYGYLRRWVVIEFDRMIAEKDAIQGLSDRLVLELPGIAAKAVASLKDVIDGAGFKVDGEVAHGSDKFAKTIDQVREWLDDCTTPAPKSVENRAVAYSSYRLWAGSQGNNPLRASEFYARIEAAGYIQKKRQGTRVFVGFIINEMRALSVSGPALEGESATLPPFFTE